MSVTEVDQPQEDQPPRSVEEESARQARIMARREARAALPATYIDSWATLIWPGHIRIVLGEWLAKKVNYRAAYVMTLGEAKAFAEELLERVAKQEKEDAEPPSEEDASDLEADV
jgi:hypothetical protein